MHPALDLTPKQRAAHREAVRLRPGDALEAIKKAIADPDDTTEVIKFSAAVTGKSVERVMRHVLALPNGKEMLEREVPLFDVLQDRDYLNGLPEGSLGRTYADWTAREQISAAGLKAESDAAARTETEIDGPYAAMNGRLRDSHDLVHVVSGYGRDLVGEIGVLAFTFGNSGHRGLGLLALIGFLRSMLPDPDQPMASRAFRRAVRGQFFAALRAGRRADFIVGADWEALLPLPLDEVRARFGIEPAAGYVEVRSAGAPDLETGLAAS